MMGSTPNKERENILHKLPDGWVLAIVSALMIGSYYVGHYISYNDAKIDKQIYQTNFKTTLDSLKSIPPKIIVNTILKDTCKESKKNTYVKSESNDNHGTNNGNIGGHDNTITIEKHLTNEDKAAILGRLNGLRMAYPNLLKAVVISYEQNNEFVQDIRDFVSSKGFFIAGDGIAVFMDATPFRFRINTKQSAGTFSGSTNYNEFDTIHKPMFLEIGLPK